MARPPQGARAIPAMGFPNRVQPRHFARRRRQICYISTFGPNQLGIPQGISLTRGRDCIRQYGCELFCLPH